MLISKTLEISFSISIFIYTISFGLNFILSAFSMLVKHGNDAGKKGAQTEEAETDMDRCLWFIPAGPLGTLLIISNIILNIINKF
jgi:hypothetical protein